MDKYGQNISGVRLAEARKLRRLRLKDLSNKFNVNLETIQKWQNRGIPQKAFISVAAFFSVEDWVFYDQNLTAEGFKEIINDPSLIDMYRPVTRFVQKSPFLLFTYEDYYKGNGYSSFFKSAPFFTSCDSVLVCASFWGGKENSYISVAMYKSLKEEFRGMTSAMLPRAQEMYIFSKMQIDIKEKTTEQQFFKIYNPGDYYLVVYSCFRFEILVYEMKYYPGAA